MVFRRPLKHLWFYPFLMTAIVGLAYVILRQADWYSLKGNPFGGLITLSMVAWVILLLSWVMFTSKITVDDRGVRWKEGRREGRLTWDEISSLVQDGVTLGLVEKASARIVPLPFVTRKLYQVLSARLNRLKPEEESILFG